MAAGNPVQFRATIKKAGGRPATDPGDKPVFEVLLKTTVSPANLALMHSLGKDATVTIVPDADPQPELTGFERTTTVDRDSTVQDTGVTEATGTTADAESAGLRPASEVFGEKTVIPSAGRRRNGTRSPEQVPPPDPETEPTPIRSGEPVTV